MTFVLKLLYTHRNVNISQLFMWRRSKKIYIFKWDNFLTTYPHTFCYLVQKCIRTDMNSNSCHLYLYKCLDILHYSQNIHQNLRDIHIFLWKKIEVWRKKENKFLSFINFHFQVLFRSSFFTFTFVICVIKIVSSRTHRHHSCRRW